ncbi:hypothetical protein GCM10027615_55650 [Plantactinospora veratri]
MHHGAADGARAEDRDSGCRPVDSRHGTILKHEPYLMSIVSVDRGAKKRMMSSAAVGESIIAWTRADISAIG